MIFDTHAHYDDEAFNEDREELLGNLQSQGIGAVVNIGASIATSRNTIALTETYPFIYGAIGVHPNETGSRIAAETIAAVIRRHEAGGRSPEPG